MKRYLAVAAVTATMIVGLAGPAAAHTHKVTTGNGTVVELANGASHTIFPPDEDGDGYRDSCGVLDGQASNHAAYGLETAHHGPDEEPGRGDGCYTIYGSPLDPANDTNPAID